MKELLHALLIDDDHEAFLVTKAILEQITRPTIELDWVPTYEEGQDALAEGEYDIYLVDYFLEERSGLDLLREATRNRLEAPVIMLTGRGNHQVDIEAMEAGAADYLVKGHIGPEDLERSIRYALDRMEAQRALRSSEERHRAMFDNLPLGVYRGTPEGGFLDANPALVRMLGYPDSLVLERDYAPRFYVSADHAEPFAARLHEFGIVRGFESVLSVEDGQEIRLRNTARLHRDGDGNVSYVEGIIEDVSRSLQASHAAEVHREAARYKALYECGHTAVLTLGRSGAIQGGNPAFHELSGYSPEDLSSLEYAELFEEADRAKVTEEVGQLMAGDAAMLEAVHELRSKGGESQTVDAVSILIRDWDGEPDHVVITLEAKSKD